MLASFLAAVLSVQATLHREHRCTCKPEVDTYVGVVTGGYGADGHQAQVRFVPVGPVVYRGCPHEIRTRRR